MSGGRRYYGKHRGMVLNNTSWEVTDRSCPDS